MVSRICCPFLPIEALFLVLPRLRKLPGSVFDFSFFFWNIIMVHHFQKRSSPFSTFFFFVFCGWGRDILFNSWFDQYPLNDQRPKPWLCICYRDYFTSRCKTGSRKLNQSGSNGSCQPRGFCCLCSNVFPCWIWEVHPRSLAKIAPENLPSSQRKGSSEPTIHFQWLLLLNFGLSFVFWCPNVHHLPRIRAAWQWNQLLEFSVSFNDRSQPQVTRCGRFLEDHPT